MVKNYEYYHLSRSTMQDKLLEEILYRRRQQSIIRISAAVLLVVTQVAAAFLMVNKNLTDDLRYTITAFLPMLAACAGFLFGRNFDSTIDSLQKYKIDAELEVLDELSRKEQDLMILRDELIKQRRS